jgi:hypothetical protein
MPPTEPYLIVTVGESAAEPELDLDPLGEAHAVSARTRARPTTPASLLMGFMVLPFCVVAWGCF